MMALNSSGREDESKILVLSAGKDPPLAWYSLNGSKSHPRGILPSLVAMSKAKGKKTRAKFNAESLERRQAYYDKMQMQKEEQLKSAEKALIDATYLHKQYNSPAC